MIRCAEKKRKKVGPVFGYIGRPGPSCCCCFRFVYFISFRFHFVYFSIFPSVGATLFRVSKSNAEWFRSSPSGGEIAGPCSLLRSWPTLWRHLFSIYLSPFFYYYYYFSFDILHTHTHTHFIYIFIYFNDPGALCAHFGWPHLDLSSLSLMRWRRPTLLYTHIAISLFQNFFHPIQYCDFHSIVDILSTDRRNNLILYKRRKSLYVCGIQLLTLQKIWGGGHTHGL
jgi:hypothetical protein